jgi:hypothetical protein
MNSAASSCSADQFAMAALRPLRGPETSPRINKGTSGLGEASSAPRFVSYVESHQPIVNHSQGLSRLLSQPRGRYDVIRPAPPAPDQHLAIDDQAFGSGRPRPARQRNRAACTADKVFVITPDRQLERMARAQIDDRCRRMGYADRQEPCLRSRHGGVPSASATASDVLPALSLFQGCCRSCLGALPLGARQMRRAGLFQMCTPR